MTAYEELRLLKQKITRNTILGHVAGFAGLIILVNPFSANSALNPLGVVSLDSKSQYSGRLAQYIPQDLQVI